MPLVPRSVPANGRGDFFIHGGIAPGSAGCIDLGPNEKAYFDAVRATGERSHEVIVGYDPRLETSPHPLAGDYLWSGIGDYFNRPLPGLTSTAIPATPASNSKAASFRDGLGSWSPSPAENLPQSGGLPGLIAEYMRGQSGQNASRPEGSVFDVGAPEVPFASSNELAPSGPASFDERFKAASPVRRLATYLRY